MKLYLQNSHGEIRRIDKLKTVQSVLPKDTDYSRRLLLCSQNKIPFEPYVLSMKGDSFENFKFLVGDAKPVVPVMEYRIFDETELCLLRIVKDGKE